MLREYFIDGRDPDRSLGRSHGLLNDPD